MRDGEHRLPHCGWALRTVPGSRGRPALEIHDDGRIVDVSVATALATMLVRGARRSPRNADREPWSVAWGQLPPGADAVGVAFQSSRRAMPAQVLVVEGRYWVAETSGIFRRVTVYADGVGVTARVKPYRGGSRDRGADGRATPDHELAETPLLVGSAVAAPDFQLGAVDIAGRDVPAGHVEAEA